MMDALYILGTVGFFGLMAAYVRWCDALGKRQEAAGEEKAP
jgi:hypothetical protein